MNGSLKSNLKIKMVKVTKPKEAYGYYCDLCGKKICKYSLDFRKCGGVTCGCVGEEKEVCHDCAKMIMEDLLDLHDL